jgi:hypothetical protein
MYGYWTNAGLHAKNTKVTEVLCMTKLDALRIHVPYIVKQRPYVDNLTILFSYKLELKSIVTI